MCSAAEWPTDSLAIVGTMRRTSLKATEPPTIAAPWDANRHRIRTETVVRAAPARAVFIAVTTRRNRRGSLDALPLRTPGPIDAPLRWALVNRTLLNGTLRHRPSILFCEIFPGISVTVVAAGLFTEYLGAAGGWLALRLHLAARQLLSKFTAE
jgi:hypothetical protein